LANPLGELKRSPYLLAAKRGGKDNLDRREWEGERIGRKGLGRNSRRARKEGKEGRRKGKGRGREQGSVPMKFLLRLHHWYLVPFILNCLGFSLHEKVDLSLYMLL